MNVSRTRALVLLVDDSPTQGQRSAQALEQAGFRVRLAGHGREALEQARRWHPDVIVSDVLMPVMDGFGLCREVRRDETLQGVPVILHTMTYVDPQDEAFALGLGATRFVLKPSDPAQLVVEVRAALDVGHVVEPTVPTLDEEPFLKGYSERLAAKLEDKVAELEQAYRRLEASTAEQLRRAQEEIAERARSAEQLLRSESRKSAVLDGALDCIVTLDHFGRIVEFNPAAERSFGYRAADVIGKPASELIVAPRIRPAYQRRLAAGFNLDDGGPALGRRVELAVLRADGTEFPAEITIARLPTEGAPMFTAFVRDLTEQKRAEAALDRLARRNELILESLEEGIIGLDREGHSTFANPAALHMLGYADEEIRGRSLHDLVHQSRAADECPATRTLKQGATIRSDEEVFWRKDGTRFPVEFVSTPLHDGDAVVGAVVTFRDITVRRRAQAALQRQAWHDMLTGLPNRARLRIELERLAPLDQTNPQPFALLLLDLDRFKEINDTLGHRSGDVLLQQIAPRFGAQLREGDLLARLGGDEFAVVLPGADADTARRIAERLLTALERPFELDGSLIELGGSVGIALYPQHAGHAESVSDTLLRHADVAMYTAKLSRGGHALYEPDADCHSSERLALLSELRQALRAGDLVLHYQPQVDVRSGQLAAVEALVRWPHPVRGMVPPNEFIPLAEQSRLIRPLSRWLLDSALGQCATWREAGLDIPIAVNLSAYDLQDASLPELIAELLPAHGVPPDRLRVEITEGSLMADPERSRHVLSKLRERGVQIAIDDFGTGYSSLAYLKDLPVDELKIDRSFVQDMTADAGSRAIVRAVIDLADDLGLRVVAEGVEDRATWEALAALGAHVAQGYYFAPPLAAAELASWAERLVDWRLEEGERRRLEAALVQRTGERNARLAAEQEFVARKRAEWALREGQERLRFALDAAGMATWDWDLVQDTIAWSGAAAALFGQDSGVDRGPQGFLQRVHADDRAPFEAALTGAVEHGHDLRVEHRILRPDGTIRWLACSARVMRDPAGRPVRLLGIEIDITERRAAEQQRQALAQAEKLRALGQMASGVAHDLNQSLGLIAGYGALAARALEAPVIDREALAEALPIIAQAALDGGETVRRLLTFARSQPPEGAAERVHLGALVREVAQLTAPRWRDASQAAGSAISLHVETEGDSTILGWPVGLREALTNLVFNAVDALPSGGTIRLSARRADGQAVVEVADSGIGMTAEVQARIFEPFFTTKGERGTGLGLAQVFGVVDQHHGTIAIDSAPGKGTALRLSFPAAPYETSREPAKQVAQAAESSLRILAVDDEPSMGNMIRRILRPGGHRVVVATSGEEALERLAAEPFDVVISDVGMGPGMNGWELVERVHRTRSRVRIVLATGWGAAIDSSEARARGVDAVLAKPYRPDELENVLARLTAVQPRDHAA